MSAELAAILATVVTVGVGLAGLTVVLWRDLRAEDAELREDIRAVRAAIDADRVAHEGLHVAERQARAEERRELLAAMDADRVAHEALHAAEREARTEERHELLAAIAAIGEGAA